MIPFDFSKPQLSIGITTFKRRMDLVIRMIQSIRSFDGEIPILVTMNSDFNELLDEDYRTGLLSFIATQSRVYPIAFPAFSSLSKMWNTLIINAPTSHVLLCNDDLEITKPDFIANLRDRIKQGKGALAPVHDLLLLNGSWSHFCIGKLLAHRLGYFDERLLAFGEEDGDFLWRFIDAFGEEPSVLTVEGIQNIGEGYRINNPNFANEDRGPFFRPVFNRMMINLKYASDPAGHKAWFSEKKIKAIPDCQQYPYEEFKIRNFPAIGTCANIEMGTMMAQTKFKAQFKLRNIRKYIERIINKAKRMLRSNRNHLDF